MEESTSGPMDEQEETPAIIEEVINQGIPTTPPPKPREPEIKFIAQKKKGYWVGHIRIDGKVVRGVLGSGSSSKETKENLIRNWMANMQNIPTEPGVTIENILKADVHEE